MSDKASEPITIIMAGVLSKYSELPKFSFPTMNDLTPLGLTQALIDCSTALEAHREFKAELNLIVHQLTALSRAAVSPASKELAENTKEEVLAYSSSVEEKTVMLNTHLTTLRGLKSAVSKSKTPMGQTVVESDEG